MSRKYLSVTGLKKVQETLLLVSHYEQTARILQQSIAKVVQEETGIDLSSGAWKLDAQTGELEEVEEKNE